MIIENLLNEWPLLFTVGSYEFSQTLLCFSVNGKRNRFFVLKCCLYFWHYFCLYFPCFFFLVQYTTRLAKAGLCSLLVTRSMFWNYLLNNTRLLWTKKFNTILPYCLSQEFKSKERSTSKRFLNSLECVARFNLQACVTNHFLIFFFLSLRYVFAAIYTVEMFLKIIGRGFALHKYAYLRNAWNWLDFLVVVLG